MYFFLTAQQSSEVDVTPRRTSRRRSAQEKDAIVTSDLTGDLDTDLAPVPEAQRTKEEQESTNEEPAVTPAGGTEEQLPEEEEKKEVEKEDKEREEEKEQVEKAKLERKAEEECPPCLEEVQGPPPPSSVREPDYHFECICGETGLLDYKVSFLDLLL